ncbi:MAG: hypothetical protein K8W52_46625 [Deltaproteobacteria bacterium]|nr:hypothetical protein [Deltaproteobacteria bacterium]
MPVARVVRQAGALVAPPRVSLGSRLRGAGLVLATRGRATAEVALGLWPLTAIMIVAGALLWSAGTAGSP